jgi:hypothetical protein
MSPQRLEPDCRAQMPAVGSKTSRLVGGGSEGFDPRYRRKGPPPLALRALGPLIVLSTVAVFATGIALLILGRGSRHSLGLAHKVSFIAWIVFTGVHVLGHLPEIGRYLSGAAAAQGRAGRALALSTALATGFVLAAALVPQFGAWTR